MVWIFYLSVEMPDVCCALSTFPQALPAEARLMPVLFGLFCSAGKRGSKKKITTIKKTLNPDGQCGSQCQGGQPKVPLR